MERILKLPALVLAPAAAAVLPWLLSPPSACAHALESSLEPLGALHSTLQLQSRFSTGVPAAAAAVSLVAPGQVPVPLGLTDAQGVLRFELPKLAQADWELKVEQGAGHRDYLELPQLQPQPRPQSPAMPMAWGAGSLLLAGVVIGRLRHSRR